LIPKQFQGFGLVFGDGACSGNPGRGGWGTICVHPNGQVREFAGQELATTNNRMELRAVIEGIHRLKPSRAPLQIFTDSTYVIRGITQWIHGWRRKGWRTAEGRDVLNRELWEDLSRVVLAHGLPVTWNYVRGHAGYPGNERVDELAVAGSKDEKPVLFQGVIGEYPIDLWKLPESFAVPDSKKPGASSVAAFYLSWLDGTLQKHKTWAECEARVKGRSGAKFKKVATAEEAAQVADGWGAQYSDLIE
jgi:ribonuclease HI